MGDTFELSLWATLTLEVTRPPGQLSEREPEPPKRPLLPLWGILALLAVAALGVVLVLSR